MMVRRRGKLAVVDMESVESILIAGDIHGDVEAFKRAKKMFEEEKDAVLIFLGDYADRGDHGLEVIKGVIELLDRYPERVVALKGNHEDYRQGKPWFSPWTLGWEVEAKLGIGWSEFYKWFERRFLSRLDIAVLLPGLGVGVHGGVCKDINEVRVLENPQKDVEINLLWSDPMNARGEVPNPRGAGVLFGPDVTESVLSALGAFFIFRGHEPRKAWDGPFLEHGGRVITTSCTSIYGGRPFLLRLSPGSKHTAREIERSAVFL